MEERAEARGCVLTLLPAEPVEEVEREGLVLTILPPEVLEDVEAEGKALQGRELRGGSGRS